MDVPDWLMKPTKNNRQHIKIMSLIEHVQRASERRGIDPFLEKQLDKLERVHLEHAQDTADLDDGVMGDVKKVVFHNKIKVFIIGSIVVSSIFIPYFLITRTTAFMQKPLLCQVFPTKDYRHPGQLEVCINGVTKAFSPQNGDVELDLTFQQSATSRVQADVTFWISDRLGYKDVDYTGEYNTSRIRIYDKGFLVSDNKDKVSSWINPIVPVDVRLPLWSWVKKNEMRYNWDRPPLEERLSNRVDESGAMIATIGSILLFLYRFLRASH